MKHIFYIFIAITLFGCGSKVELNKQFFTGTWQCIDYKIESKLEIPKEQLDETIEATKNSVYTFTDSVFSISMPFKVQNQTYTHTLDFNWELTDSEPKQLKLTSLNPQMPINYTQTITEYTENTIILTEVRDSYTATTYLQRAEN